MKQDGQVYKVFILSYAIGLLMEVSVVSVRFFFGYVDKGSLILVSNKGQYVSSSGAGKKSLLCEICVTCFFGYLSGYVVCFFCNIRHLPFLYTRAYGKKVPI